MHCGESQCMELCIARCAGGFISILQQELPLLLSSASFFRSVFHRSVQLCRQCGHECHCTHTNQHGGVQNTVLRETFEGENVCESRGFVPFCKSFPCKIWGVAPFGMAKVSNSRTFSPRKSYFPPIHNSFPLKCFRYTVEA